MTRFRILLSASAFALVGGILLLGLDLPWALRLLGAVAVVGAWGAPLLLLAQARARAAALRSNRAATTKDLASTRRMIESRVDDTRAKQSRHEYHQEQSLARIEATVRRLLVSVDGSDVGLERRHDVLFVTSNGAGLGHISRLLAIASELPAHRTYQMLTLSKAYRQVASSGTTIHYFPSSEASGESPARWNAVFARYFRSLMDEVRPRVVVFDGTWVYTGLTDVCRALGVPLIWVQRGCWKTEVDEASVQRHHAITAADEVIVPGDYAGREDVDNGPDIDTHYVGPVALTRRADLLDRDAACRDLGLDPSRRYVLLNLGGGLLGDPDSIASAALRLLAEHAPDLQPVQVISPLAAQQGSDDERVIAVQAYPVARHFRAFDLAIAAAGYNVVQETISLGLPAILVPNEATKTDDQVRRAEAVAACGLALVARDEGMLKRTIRHMADAGERRLLQERLGQIPEANGSVAAAEALEDMIRRASWPDASESISE
ncbi:glycosyltransferase [Brachybacterium phenoliresistens]|uniref:glycosyltransferase n=1 Tax=Brachybacterium phenoliresistens TaxID=396014 RepID=UPI0031DA8542